MNEFFRMFVVFNLGDLSESKKQVEGMLRRWNLIVQCWKIDENFKYEDE